MGKKFTHQDLFRIANDNLSLQDQHEFQFICATETFRSTVGDIFQPDLGISKDERNLLEKIFSRIRTGGIFRGGR